MAASYEFVLYFTIAGWKAGTCGGDVQQVVLMRCDICEVMLAFDNHVVATTSLEFFNIRYNLSLCYSNIIASPLSL